MTKKELSAGRARQGQPVSDWCWSRSTWAVPLAPDFAEVDDDPSTPGKLASSSLVPAQLGSEQSCVAACILVPATALGSSSPDAPPACQACPAGRASSLRPVVHDVVWCRSSDIPAQRQCHPAHRHWSCSSIRRIRSTMVRPLPGLVPQPMCGSVQAPSPERASSPIWACSGDGHKRTASPSFFLGLGRRLDLEFISHSRTLNCLSYSQTP